MAASTVPGTDALTASFAALQARLQPDGATITVYDADESNPRAVPLLITNARSLTTTRVASKVVIATGPLGADIRISNLVQYAGAADQANDQWFVVADALIAPTGGLANPTVQMHRLPYTLTRTRVAETAGALADTYALNGYDEPRTGEAAGSVETGTTATVRYGVNNESDLLSEVIVGRLPQATLTIITPLGTDMAIGDQVVLDDGTFAVVTQRNPAAMDGPVWGRQFILTASGGEGALPSP